MTRTRPPAQRAVADRRAAGAFAALELAILTPFVIVMLLLVVGFGRVERGRELLDQAAASAARAASLTTSPGAAQAAANTAARSALSSGGLSCAGIQVSVDTAAFGPGGAVSAKVSCTAELSGLTLSGLPGRVRLAARATSPLEPYRQFDSAGAP
jgi:Flp pilus assembly protein TadG